MKSKITKYRSLSLILCLCCSINVQSEEIPNYCHDEETNAKWESIAKRNASNPDVINLYRLRKELCRQVEKGFIGVTEATEIFEEERERVIKSLSLPRA